MQKEAVLQAEPRQIVGSAARMQYAHKVSAPAKLASKAMDSTVQVILLPGFDVLQCKNLSRKPACACLSILIIFLNLKKASLKKEA